METISDYKKAFRDLAENCRKKFGASTIEVFVYDDNDIRITFR